jgi:hypothetical protein
MRLRLGGELDAHEFEVDLASGERDLEGLAASLVGERDQADDLRIVALVGVDGDGLDGIAVVASDTVEDIQGSGDAGADGVEILHGLDPFE